MGERPDWQTRLRQNLADVRQVIAAACARAGRQPAEVTLVAVTKYVSLDVVRALLAEGVRDLGESRAQQLVERAERVGAKNLNWTDDATPSDGSPRWHMIGHVQRNKVRMLLPHTRILHSVDSERLAAALQEHAERMNAVCDVLLEVNAGEESKEGIAAAQLPALAATVAQYPRVRIRGLMTMAPYDPDPEQSRPHFVRLRELLTGLRDSGAVGPDCRHLSMGMSQDYAVAIEEGATLVRVGSVLFEGLPTTDPRV